MRPLLRAPGLVVGLLVATSAVSGGCHGDSPPAEGGGAGHLPVATIGNWSGRRPSTIYFSADAGNVATGLTWATWTASKAVGRGVRKELSCVPDCADGSATSYPVTITMTDPVHDRFTAILEQTADGRGTTEAFHDPFLGDSACSRC